MSTTAALSPLTLQGALYTRRTIKSPMAQLTSLKTIGSSTSTGSIDKVDDHLQAPISSTSTSSSKYPVRPKTQPEVPRIPSPGERRPLPATPGDLGVPARPGCGALNSRLGQLKRQSAIRPDLGMVGPRQPPPGLGTVSNQTLGAGDSDSSSSTLGTISTLLFGRKGGLL